MRALFACNQGGVPVVELNLAISEHFGESIAFSVLLESEKELIQSRIGGDKRVHSLEAFEADYQWGEDEVERVRESYPEVRWGEVMASERTFSDYSSLDGGAGQRSVELDYVIGLICRMVSFYEKVFEEVQPELVVCQTADSLFTHVLFKVAKHVGVPLYAVTPAWLHDFGDRGSFFFTNDEYLGCRLMDKTYASLGERELSGEEKTRVENFKAVVKGFDGNKAFYSAAKRNFGRSPVSPNVRSLGRYLANNSRRNPDVEYFSIDPWRKFRANAFRVWRKRAAGRWLDSGESSVPSKSVFLPLHFQPEQSTLVGGIYHVNQLALVENVSKALPIGYVLVVKEHPAGRGTRPVSHYRQMMELPNVMFCDDDSKEIVKKVECVVTVTGTIGIESLVLDTPVIMLGRSFFGFSELLYRVESVTELAPILYRILVEGEFRNRPDRERLLDRFLAAYLLGLRESFPRPENGDRIADHVRELRMNLEKV